MILKPKYIEYLNRKNLELIKINDLDVKDYTLKDIFQANYKFGKQKALLIFKNEVLKEKTKFFKLLDNCVNPYEVILSKTFSNNTYNNIYGTYCDKYTGVSTFNISICSDYSFYKIFKQVR